MQCLEVERKPYEHAYRIQFKKKNSYGARLNLCFNATPDVAASIRERLLQQLRQTAHHGLKEDRWSDAQVGSLSLVDIITGAEIPGLGCSNVRAILGSLDHQFVQGMPGSDRVWTYIHPADAGLLVALVARRPPGERTYRIASLNICVCFNATPDEAAVVKERLLWLLRREAGHGLAEASGSGLLPDGDTVDGDLVTGRLISADVEPLLPPGTPTDMLSYYAPDHEHTAVILGLRRWCHDHPGKGVYLVVSRDSLMALYAALTPDEFVQLRQRLARLDRASAHDNLKEGLLPSPA